MINKYTFEKFYFFSGLTSKNIRFPSFFKTKKKIRLLIALLCTFFLYAQKKTTAENGSISPSITIAAGAKVYSEDVCFNDQIVSEKVILKNSDYSYKINKRGASYLRLTAKKHTQRKRPVNKSIRMSTFRKVRLKKTDKKLFKSRKTDTKLRISNFYDLPNDEKILHSDYLSAKFLFPVQQSSYRCKQCDYDYQIRTGKPLNYLHRRKYISSTQRSRDFCFSTVYSVRPPPLFFNI